MKNQGISGKSIDHLGDCQHRISALLIELVYDIVNNELQDYRTEIEQLRTQLAEREAVINQPQLELASVSCEHRAKVFKERGDKIERLMNEYRKLAEKFWHTFRGAAVMLDQKIEPVEYEGSGWHGKVEATLSQSPGSREGK